MQIGDTIQKLRKDKNMSQEELAEKVGFTRQTISKWELGQSSPDIEYIKLLCKTLEVSADFLINGAEEELIQKEEVQKANKTQDDVVENSIKHEKKPLQTKFLSGLLCIGICVFLAVLNTVLYVNDKIEPAALYVISGIFTIIGVELLLIKSKKSFCIINGIFLTIILIWIVLSILLSTTRTIVNQATTSEIHVVTSK